MQKTVTKYAQLDQYKNLESYRQSRFSQSLIVVSAFLVAFSLTMLCLLSGCMMQLTAKDVQKMTPEQITAYKDSGFKIFSCFKLSGPPPAGSELFIVIPSDAKAEFNFLPDCSIMPTKVTP